MQMAAPYLAQKLRQGGVVVPAVDFCIPLGFRIFRDHATDHPPSTKITVPVIKDAADEARNTTAPVTSWGMPMRPRGIWSSVCFWNAAFSRSGRVASVQMK